MLRRLDIKDPWRSLDSGFWPEDLPAGCKTVVYGHNGSGKSTLSELLLSLAEDSAATSVVWEGDDKQRTNVATGGTSPSPAMAVFTRKWVEGNLSAFLDGASASAIVTLGREAIDAKEEEERLVEEIATLREQADGAEKQRVAAASKVNALAKGVQDRIVAQLRAFDYNHFTRNRYSVPKVQEDLRSFRGEIPDSEVHSEALKRLGEGAPAPVADVVPPPAGAASKLADLADLLAETPTRVAIAALDGNPIQQTWVERGLALHEGVDHCLFCDGLVSEKRRAQLARHFDESWLNIRSKAKELLVVMTREKQAISGWHASLPTVTSLAGDLQGPYADALTLATDDVNSRIYALEAVMSVLDAKAADPSATPAAPDWQVLSDAPSTTVLTQAVDEHNDQARRHEEVTTQRKEAVLAHLIGSESVAFQALEKQAADLAEMTATRKKAAALAETRLEKVREAQFTTKDMADTLTRDLARVYGKDHLTVAVTADGKSYACRRGDTPGTDLSEGERTTLSLLYFLRKLEDEQVPGGDPSQRIVVIDDPSSSLDREALFATHQWLIDTLKIFGQYIVLTHDFSLLRLFVKSQNSAWGKSMKRMTQGNADEIRFPKVSFLEMYAASSDGGRRSKVGKLPRLLLNNTSEYSYLFAMVMAGVADSEDHERLFLLPNATRRILEVFASYKAPHLGDFSRALEAMVKEQDGEPYRDVYDFCNRYSHGEGSETVDVLDARAVHGQIRRCMEFLQAVDSEHFERMCMATGVDPAALT
ncbi:AAA family ATPase [Nocardioides sp. CFH 31398]|uniref:AAA family ATPase n=1 Tax=Nocardioides sp. CFH 31398 TaxID=2919579 RepID=UPI001F068346|nr:AAA family ATPase [Nocardioides sp. CFH 31398]MCH1868782.1 AAA family ATPase [Nocardioides sp. CFH 31398]